MMTWENSTQKCSYVKKVKRLKHVSVADTWCKGTLPGVLLCLVLASDKKLLLRNLDDLACCVFTVTLEGGPAAFGAVLHCSTSVFLMITSLCHCWFIKLNCFLLLCVLSYSGTSWESLDPEHNNSNTVHSPWNFPAFYSQASLIWFTNSLLSFLSLAITSLSASQSVSCLS